MVLVGHKKPENSAAAFVSARLLLIGISAIALTAGAATARAQSQPTTGLYIGGVASANLQEDNRLRDRGGSSADSYDLRYAGTLAFGYGLDSGLRLEIEPGYRNNAVDTVQAPGM
jgi:hypothetical protein